MPRVKEDFKTFNKKLRQEKAKEFQQKRTKEKLLVTEKVSVHIPVVYESLVGKNIPISVGLETITIPVDGKTYSVRKPFAEALKVYLSQIDKEATRSKQKFGGYEGDVSPTGPIPGK
jgi:transposase